MRRRLVKILSALMMVVFLAGILPKQYLHDLLFDHHDTVHADLKKGELVISSKHTHCSFVGFAFGPFVSSEKLFLSFRHVPVHVRFVIPKYRYRYASVHYAASLRGPPAVSRFR